MVDERGQVIDGDQLMAVIAESWHMQDRLAKSGLVATVMSNLGLERFVNGLGIELLRTRVGDRYVLEAMRHGGYNLGGEQRSEEHTSELQSLMPILYPVLCLKKKNTPMKKTR